MRWSLRSMCQIEVVNRNTMHNVYKKFFLLQHFQSTTNQSTRDSVHFDGWYKHTSFWSVPQWEIKPLPWQSHTWDEEFGLWRCSRVFCCSALQSNKRKQVLKKASPTVLLVKQAVMLCNELFRCLECMLREGAALHQLADAFCLFLSDCFLKQMYNLCTKEAPSTPASWMKIFPVPIEDVGDWTLNLKGAPSF